MHSKRMEAAARKSVQSKISDNQLVSHQKASAEPILKHEDINNPFCSTPHIDAMMHRGIVLAPLLLHWNYYVSDVERFCNWLGTRDIIFNRFRFKADKDLADVHYNGTYIISSKVAASYSETQLDRHGASHTCTHCLTVWGIHSEAGLLFLNSLFSGNVARRSLLQNDLLQFIKELKTFVETSQCLHFSEDVFVSAAVPYAAAIDNT